MRYPATDKNGRAYLKLSEAKVGMKVWVDDGFNCLAEGEHTIEQDNRGALYIPCTCGKHYIDGQVIVIGVYPL